VHAVFPSRRGQVPAVRSFLDFMGKHMRGEQLVGLTEPSAPKTVVRVPQAVL
jgi:hypothetical protein